MDNFNVVFELKELYPENQGILGTHERRKATDGPIGHPKGGVHRRATSRQNCLALRKLKN
jgi:hypothetical protein